MTPLRRYNKVAPSPQKMTTKTPTTTNTQTIGKENRKQSLQASSESSLLDGSPRVLAFARHFTATVKYRVGLRTSARAKYNLEFKLHVSLLEY